MKPAWFRGALAHEVGVSTCVLTKVSLGVFSFSVQSVPLHHLLVVWEECPTLYVCTCQQSSVKKLSIMLPLIEEESLRHSMTLPWPGPFPFNLSQQLRLEFLTEVCSSC